MVKCNWTSLIWGFYSSQIANLPRYLLVLSKLLIFPVYFIIVDFRVARGLGRNFKRVFIIDGVVPRADMKNNETEMRLLGVGRRSVPSEQTVFGSCRGLQALASLRVFGPTNFCDGEVLNNIREYSLWACTIVSIIMTSRGVCLFVCTSELRIRKERKVFSFHFYFVLPGIADLNQTEIDLEIHSDSSNMRGILWFIGTKCLWFLGEG